MIDLFTKKSKTCPSDLTDAGSYTVTFTGSGTFDFSGENVILIENLDWSAWTKENQSITVDDVSTGITEAEGKVTLRYVVTLE